MTSISKVPFISMVPLSLAPMSTQLGKWSLKSLGKTFGEQVDAPYKMKSGATPFADTITINP
jgi:hypothetical protein